MTLRVSQGTIHTSVSSVGNVGISQGVVKASVGSLSDPVVSTVLVRAAVRVYQKRAIAKIVPPVNLTMICSCNPVCCFTFE